MKKNNIQVLVADIGRDQSLTALLDELGGEGRPIPFYAIYPANGAAPITFDDFPLTSAGLISYLQQGLEAGQTTAAGERSTSQTESGDLIGRRDALPDGGGRSE